MIQVHDTIEGSGYPLGFCLSRGGERPSMFAGAPGHAVLRVDARAMGAHQKEAVIHEGPGGPSWRLVSDEGPYLKGSDMAPFPLGFFNAGLQADLLGHLTRLASESGTGLDDVRLELDSGFSFSGSFFKGDGRGTAEPAQVRLALRSGAPALAVVDLVRRAIAASPALAAMSTPLDCTFALYVNGIRREVIQARPSSAPDASDPLKTYPRPPAPVLDGRDLGGIITKMPMGAVETQEMPSSGAKFDLRVLGSSRVADLQSRQTEVAVRLKAPPGSSFGFRTDEASLSSPVAPSGLAVLSAGVAFCYMTQLLRYSEYLKYKVRAIRLVQFNPYSLQSRAGGGLSGAAAPVDTHLFLHGDEPDEVMQRLLVMGAQTCYLHAALKSALPPVVSATLNGQPLSLE